MPPPEPPKAAKGSRECARGAGLVGARPPLAPAVPAVPAAPAAPAAPGEPACFFVDTTAVWVWSVVAATALKLLLFPAYLSTDFDVHRNWLSVTTLPLERWYVEDTCRWTLDYPPFFAYFEWVLSRFVAWVVAPLFNADVAGDLLSISRDCGAHRSPDAVLFQRLSVVASDTVLFLGIAAFLRACGGAAPPPAVRSRAGAALALAVLSPGLLLVDHVHFQYNGMLLGVLLLSLALLRRGKWALGALAFAACVNLKHLFLYCAPAVFVFVLRAAIFPPATGHRGRGRVRVRVRGGGRWMWRWRRLASVGLPVLAVFVASFGPFVWHGQFAQVLRRLFPFGRGLLHTYWAPNFWALYTLADLGAAALLGVPAPPVTRGTSLGVFDHAVLPSVSPLASLGAVGLALLPMVGLLWRRPHPTAFVLAAVVSALSFFVFGWHVHEKAVLTALVPLTCLLADPHSPPALPRTWFVLAAFGTASLLPLLPEPAEAPVKIVLPAAYFLATAAAPALRMRLHRSELLLLLGLSVPVTLDVAQLLGGLPESLEFLPRMAMSCYCAVGILYCYAQLYWALLSHPWGEEECASAPGAKDPRQRR